MANPIHIPAVFAEGGTKNSIYKTLQVGQPAQEATWVIGWGGITMTPIDSGGKPPLGQDFNGVLNAMCANIVHTQNAKRYQWSQDVIDNYGGYSIGSIVQSDDTLREFRSLVDSNTVNPNLGLGSSWEVYSGQGSIPIATSTTAGVMRVLNTLTSTDVGSALSAAQGKVLKDIFDKFTASLATNGYAKIPFGSVNLIVQWGVLNHGDVSSTTNFPVVFPMQFPSTVFAVVANEGGLQPCVINVINKTRDGFTAAVTELNQNIQTGNVNWIAIGY